MSRKIVLNFNDERSRWAITPEALARLRAALPPDWQMVNLSAPVSSRGDGGGVATEAISALEGAEVYAGFGFPRELFLAAAAHQPMQLRWVHTGAAGVGALLYPEMIGSDVVVTNSAGIHAPAIAETVIAAALHFARGFDFAVRDQAEAVWNQAQFESVTSPVIELAGATMGILGFGGIGREVAKRAQALGMHVLATRRRAVGTADGVRVLAGDAAGVQHVLSHSDVVVISMPSTAETRALLGRDQLALLKPHAVLINVARGNIIDEDALIELLQQNRIRGAALDVFAHEPLASDSPLWRLPNTLILPHISATTPRFWEREVQLIQHNLQCYLENRPMTNVVDKQAGY